MIDQYKAKNLVDTAQCTYSNIRVVGEYSSSPIWHFPSYLGSYGMVHFVPPTYKEFAWDLYCTGWGNEPPSPRAVSLAKFQSYACPAGFSGEDTATPDMSRVCVPARSMPHVFVKKITQTFSCPANPYPCHPDNGDKSRIEPDFEFAGRPFNRYYHSLRQFSLGREFPLGWSYSYSSLLEFAYGYIISDEGYYAKLTDVGGGFFSVGMSTSTLEKVSDSLYVLRNGNGEVRSYDGEGRLVRVQDVMDPARDVVVKNESIPGFASLHRIAALIDRSGRSVHFHYKNGRLESVELPDGQRINYIQNDLGNLLAVDYGTGGVKRYHYGEVGLAANLSDFLLTGITSEDGRRYASFGYDLWNRVISSELHGDSGKVQGTYLSYQGDQSVLVKTADGEVVSYQFDSGFYRSPLLIQNSQGGESTQHDGLGRLVQRINRRGFVEKFSYSGAQRVSADEAVGTAEHRSERTDWHPTLNLPLERRVVSGQGQVVSIFRWTYNSRGQVLTQRAVDPVSGDERRQSFAYCEEADVGAGYCPELGLPRSIDGPRTDVADTVTYAWYHADDAGCATNGACAFRKGDLRSITNALGQGVEVLSYDAFGRPLSVRDANGVVTDYSYHPRGWPTSITVRGATTADDRSTQISYWPTGQVQQVTEPDGSSVTYVYDAAQRLTDIADSAGNTIHYTLDDAGNRLNEDTVDAGGTLRRTLARTYNILGQLTALKDAGNHATGFTYDANGNPQTVTDALQRVTSQQHDPLNRLAQTLQDVGGVAAEIRSQYNALDQVTQVTDPKGLHTTYAYNGFGDLTGQVSPDSGTSSFTVDAAGNRKTRTDARGVTATYSYDALNRLIGVAYPDPNLEIGYSYDVAPAACAADERFAKGRLGQVLHANGSTQYCHDRFGQITRKVQTINGVASTLRYAYSKAGRLTALTYPDGTVADYVRDPLGRISQVGLTRPGQARQVVVDNVTYAAFGPATGWSYGNGRQLQRPLDLDYRPQAVHDPAAGGLSLSYGYDPVGSITELKNGAGSTVLATYAYDTLGRLTQTQDGTTGTPIETYGYDATGNRTALTTAAGVANYTYPASSHRLTAVDGEARGHDAAGNTTSIGSKAFTYNDANRMNAVKQGSAVLESYAYNHRGERVLRTPTGGTAQITLYDEAGQWLGNYSASGDAQQQAIWLDNYPVALINAPAAGVPELAYIQPDHLGTPRVVIDPVRDVAIWEWSNKSEVFGNQIPSADPDGDGVAFELALRFPGQQATDASGMFYNYQREYDPAVGRYSQSDPIGLMGGISTYGYAGASPARRVDPLGLTDLNYIPPYDNPDSYLGNKMIPSPPDMLTISIHHNGEKFIGPDGNGMSVDELAQSIRRDADLSKYLYIRLYSCRTGKSIDGGPIPAQQLSKALGMTIQAPTEYTWAKNDPLYPDQGNYGKTSEGKKDKSNPGEWVNFMKEGGVK
ncbi:RHS repeat protein [Stenotrophomonas sp. YAU14A_MKIMI4_1]|nr:RHS repeat protein [Stenotrophomonas sp. YAU14A_MKIMI4_1]